MIKPGEPWPFDLTRPSEPGEETYGRDDDPSRMPARLRDLTGKQQTMIRAYVAGRAGALDVWMHLPSAEAARILGLVEALARRELDALIAPYDPAMIRAVDAEDERERAGAVARIDAAARAAAPETRGRAEASPPTSIAVPAEAPERPALGRYVGRWSNGTGLGFDAYYRVEEDLVRSVRVEDRDDARACASSTDGLSVVRRQDGFFVKSFVAMLRAAGLLEPREVAASASVAHRPPQLRRSLGFIVKDKGGFPALGGRVFDSYEAAYQHAEALHGADRVRMYFDIVERSPV